MTIWFETPPLFMISPVSMKNGIAISGKLSAPDTRFCARICVSNECRCSINETPHTSSANATGMPMNMAPHSDARKMVTVIAFP